MFLSNQIYTKYDFNKLIEKYITFFYTMNSKPIVHSPTQQISSILWDMSTYSKNTQMEIHFNLLQFLN